MNLGLFSLEEERWLTVYENGELKRTFGQGLEKRQGRLQKFM